MPVYIAQAGGELGPVKIGRASQPESRIADLQTGHYATLILLRVIDGGSALERALHKRYAAKKIRGEWFEFDASMLSDDPPLPSEPPVEIARYKTFSDQLKHLALLYCEGAGVTKTALGRLAVGDDKFFARIFNGKDFNCKKGETALLWLAANWPDEKRLWPHSIWRPAVPDYRPTVAASGLSLPQSRIGG
jgi:hypothetical protein